MAKSMEEPPLKVHTLKIRPTRESTKVSLSTPAEFIFYSKFNM